MTLRQKQQLFASLLGEFLVWIFAQGYTVTIGEVERSRSQALSNAATGAGISRSLHLIRLAADLHLFIDEVYQTSSEAHRPLGEKWESMNPLCRWGGRFNDGNHYSLEHKGVK